MKFARILAVRHEDYRDGYGQEEVLVSLFAAFFTLLISTSLANASSTTDALRKAQIDVLIMAQSLACSNVETMCAMQPYQDRLLVDSDLAKA